MESGEGPRGVRVVKAKLGDLQAEAQPGTGKVKSSSGAEIRVLAVVISKSHMDRARELEFATENQMARRFLQLFHALELVYCQVDEQREVAEPLGDSHLDIQRRSILARPQRG